VFERHTLRQWPQSFCNRGPINAWNFYRGPGVPSQQSCYGKNRLITCPESEWCQHQYTFCYFAGRGLRATALSMLPASAWRCFGSGFFFRWNISVIFADTFWSLKNFDHLSHSCIKTHHNSVFWPIYSNILTEMTWIFFGHFKIVSVHDRKKKQFWTPAYWKKTVYETYSKLLGSRMVLLTPGSDNSISMVGAKYTAKWRSHFQTKLVQLHVHGKHIYCWSGN